jgi:transposase
MDLTKLSDLATILGPLLAGLGGAYAYTRKILRIRHANILQEAKEYDKIIKKQLEDKIHEMETNIIHLKEIYSSEIKVLGDKIEILRSEIQHQNMSIMTLLGKMIDKS